MSGRPVIRAESKRNRHNGSLSVMVRSRGRIARATAAVVISSLFVAVPGAHADSLSDQKHRVEKLAAELNALNDKIAIIDEEYGAAQDKKDELAVEIKVSQAKVAEEQAQLDKVQGTMTDIAVNRFMGGKAHELSPLFASAAVFSDAQQFDALSNIAFDTGAANADDVQSLMRQFNTDTRQLQRQQKDAADLIDTLTKKKAEGEALIVTYTKKEKEAKAKYGQVVQQEAARQAELAQQRAVAKAAAAQVASAAIAPRGSGGRLGPRVSSIPLPPPPSGRAGLAIAAARSVLGVPYVAFQASPSIGFDCSGLTSWAWAQAGVFIPHQSGRQFASTPQVPKDQAQPGDLVYFYWPIHHVGLYIGGGLMIDSPYTGAFVRVATLRWDMVVGVSRPG